MLYAILEVAHQDVSMQDQGTVILARAMEDVFGTDNKRRVIEESILFRDHSPEWLKRACFGCTHSGYSLLCFRDRSDRLQVHIEITPTAHYQQACESAKNGVWNALGRSNLRMRPRLIALEVRPIGDTKPVVVGTDSLSAHTWQRATIEPVVAALAIGTVVGLGGWLFWPDQAASLLSGAVASFALGAYAVVVSILSVWRGWIRWSPAN